ncbi:MAG: heme o synthase [Candidatus Binatia bacterium]
MIPQPQTLALDVARVQRRAMDFIALAKVRVVLMVLVTTGAGFYLATHGAVDYLRLLRTLIGTALAAGGTLALNQLLERDIDAKMQRTRRRPLPDGRLQPSEALIFGATITVAGILYLALAVNWLSAVVTATTAMTYLFCYTPLKRKTPLCSVIGALPGALPPVTGWVAARQDFGIEVWILFAILFLWQAPHSLAIACLYREDYAKADIRFLPIVEPDTRSTGRQVVTNCAALLVIALLPTLVGLAGATYFCTALILSLGFLAYATSFALARTASAARHLLLASLLYLPLILLVMALDKVPM